MAEIEESVRGVVEGYGQKAKMYVELVLKDSDRYMADVEQAAESQSVQELVVASHSFKSILRQLQAYKTAEVALSIEEAARHGDLLDMTEKVKALAESYSDLKSLLERILLEQAA